MNPFYIFSNFFADNCFLNDEISLASEGQPARTFDIDKYLAY